MHISKRLASVVAGVAIIASSALVATPAEATTLGSRPLAALLPANDKFDTNPNDFDSDLRPRGAGSDIGADEFTTNAPPRITDFRLSGTNCLISFTTIPGVGYDVQRASDVTSSAWSLVVAHIAGTGGVVQSTDTNAIGQATRFYLVRLSP